MSLINQNIYENVLIGILTGSITASFISHLNYIHARESFFEYTLSELQNIIIYNKMIQYKLKMFTDDIAAMNNDNDYTKMGSLKPNDSISDMLNILSRYIQLWMTAAIKYDDLAKQSSSFIHLYRKLDNKKLVSLLDEIMKDGINRRNEHGIFSIISELKNMRDGVIPKINSICNSWLNIQITILNYQLSPDENSYKDIICQKIDELQWEIATTNKKLSYSASRILEVTMFLVAGTKYFSYWNDFKIKFESLSEDVPYKDF